MTDVLVVENLTKQFGGLRAVNDLSFTVKGRTIHSLIGPNGAGKSTVMNMCTGAFPPTSGTVKYKGELISNLPLHKITNKHISRTFQNLKLYTSMTIKENLMIGMHSELDNKIIPFILNPKKAAAEEKMLEEKADEMLNQIGLYEVRNRVVNNVAYGTQKLAELGRSLIRNPEFLFLDEPAAGLNPSERREFIDILLKVFENGTDLFLIEHNMDVVMNISDMITVISFGEKIAEGTPKEIQSNEEVIEAYLGTQYKEN